jgi:hypothetical protein
LVDPTSHAVRVTHLTAAQWRISDARLPADDPAALLGFIEKTGELFEITRNGDARYHGYARSLEDGIDRLGRWQRSSTN